MRVFSRYSIHGFVYGVFGARMTYGGSLLRSKCTIFDNTLLHHDIACKYRRTTSSSQLMNLVGLRMCQTSLPGNSLSGQVQVPVRAFLRTPRLRFLPASRYPYIANIHTQAHGSADISLIQKRMIFMYTCLDIAQTRLWKQHAHSREPQSGHLEQMVLKCTNMSL